MKKVEMLPHKQGIKMNCLKSSNEVTLYMFGNDEIKIDMYIKLLMQSSIMGSLGGRSRKGFDSFKIVKSKSYRYIKLFSRKIYP